MLWQQPLLVTLVQLVDTLLMSEPPKAERGRPRLYTDRLLKALVIMIVRHLHKVHELLTVLAEPTQEMANLCQLLTDDQGRFPSRRTWERHLGTLPDTLPTQIGCLGCYLVGLIEPWSHCVRAAAIDSTVLRALGGVWHKKDRTAGVVPHSSIDTEAHWTKSGWHGWVYGWKLHLVEKAST